MDSAVPPAPPPAIVEPEFARRRATAFFGLTSDQCIKAFFGGNAVIAIVVLALITIFLFREGIGFFGQNLSNIQVYREAGLEYVDIIRGEVDAHTALTRSLSDLRLRQFQRLTKEQKLSPADANKALAGFDKFADAFSDPVDPVRSLMTDLVDAATATKTEFLVSQDKVIERQQLLDAGRTEDAAKVVVPVIDFKSKVQPLIGTLPTFREANHEFSAKVTAVLATAPAMPTPDLQRRMDQFKEHAQAFVAGLPAVEQQLAAWDYAKPVPWWKSATTFFFGRDWLTASSWQDWYGILPLFVGSLMVSAVALLLAIPLGIGAAIYVNQVASKAEQRFIKPSIEFIAAFPSVVLGFFGIAVLGQTLRSISQLPWLAWVPGFPSASASTS